MPIVNVKLLEGRSDEQLKNLVTEVTNAVEKTTGANKNAIQVVIEEMKASHYGVAGIRKSDQQ
ncbi:2-hydroxymuconate tautomerase [Staphylococcus cohnii]|uniref:Tautomerase n=1 Tax=Staphylococcus cohnii TaxID=29382 RepID=A0ABT6J213_9STAP|nr:2-hydroxymuconate tautomerase [Staphylococcus cohnii]TGP60508.1 4-oxalocrotonate tautomerase [bacterium M00.F.Ca.ET.229.01.1.1]TGS37266.1 4-oxalocrotonate tautomerase [bacterium M00.F.Ca.ET.180.01.1.1]AYX89771.1 4-oxalocrotonate tautomerase [Staphylococcus cohnii]MCI2941986.1 4-oxalocrotonate tautomerase [Staphylococcus cohnii]MDE1710799.1 4-oxalocrotonate tautomerase [Staphylococcus cohnii]